MSDASSKDFGPRALRRTLAATLLGLTIGCPGPGPGPTPTPEPQPTEFWDDSRADTAKMRLTDGLGQPLQGTSPRVTIDQGPQGGRHVELQAWIEGAPDFAYESATLLARLDGGSLSAATGYLRTDTATSGVEGPKRFGMFLQLSRDPAGSAALEVRARDARQQATIELNVTF
jgi:hypothetical protein